MSSAKLRWLKPVPLNVCGPGEVHPQRVRQQRAGHHRGDRQARPARWAARPAPRPGWLGASDHVIRKTPQARAVKNSPSAAIEKPTATQQRPGSARCAATGRARAA